MRSYRVEAKLGKPGARIMRLELGADIFFNSIGGEFFHKGRGMAFNWTERSRRMGVLGKRIVPDNLLMLFDKINVA